MTSGLDALKYLTPLSSAIFWPRQRRGRQ